MAKELQKIVIIGAGAFAREVLDIFDAINADQPTYDVLGYIVESSFGEPGDTVHDKLILGDFDWYTEHKQDVLVICGVGAPEVRLRLVKRAQSVGMTFSKVIHPSVIRTKWMTIGEGSVIAAGCILSNQVRIGNHVHINPGCIVGHDVVFEDFVSAAPGVRVSGNVSLEEGCYVGTGANIIQNKRIGLWSIVGAGSTIIEDVPPNTTVVGVPGKVIETRPSGWEMR